MLFVVVDSQKGQRCPDDREIPIPDKVEIAHRVIILYHILWILHAKERIEEETILVAIDPAGCRAISRSAGSRNLRSKIERDAHLTLSTQVTQRLHSQAVPKQKVMGGGQRRRFVVPSWGVAALEMPHEC